MAATRRDPVRWGNEAECLEQLVGGLSGSEALDLVVEMVHDLRSPLTSILALSETLIQGRSGVVNDTQRHQLSLVNRAALSLDTITRDVMELAQGGRRLVDAEPAPFSSSEIVESVADMVRPIAEDKGLELRTVVADDIRRVGHRSALSRVLLNLTTNALRFTHEGYVEVAATASGTRGLSFSVRDTGQGIGPGTLATLRLPFCTSRTRTVPALRGTGLGLSLCQQLLRAMGSQLQVESRPGWGTRFRFDLELPLASSLRPS